MALFCFLEFNSFQQSSAFLYFIYLFIFFFLHCFDFPKLKGTHQKPRRLCTEGTEDCVHKVPS